MRKNRNRAYPKSRKSGPTKFWFDRGTAIASGVTAALVFGTTETSIGMHADEAVPVLMTPTEGGSSSDPVTSISSGIESESDMVFSNPLRPLPSALDEWTPEMQKRFHDLAVREALDQLSPEEAAELERLGERRRLLDNPRTGDEVLWEYQQRRLTRDLLVSLRKYVEFYEGPSPAWTRSAKGSNR